MFTSSPELQTTHSNDTQFIELYTDCTPEPELRTQVIYIVCAKQSVEVLLLLRPHLGADTKKEGFQQIGARDKNSFEALNSSFGPTQDSTMNSNE